MSRIAVFLPNFSDNHPNTSVKPMAPNDASDEIHDSSSLSIFPDVSGVSSDLKSSKLGPVKPITIPKMNAVRFTGTIGESCCFQSYRANCRAN